MKDDTEFGQNFRSAVNGFLTKINRMTKTRRLSLVFRYVFLTLVLWLAEGAGQSEIRLSDLPLDRVKAAEGEKEVGDEAENDDQWLISYDSY